MILSNEDWGEILEHLRRRVREAGFAEIDERIAFDYRGTNEVRVVFSHYLDSLISGLTERSLSGYNKALRTLDEALEVEGNGRVDGIEVLFREADIHLYGVERMDLSQVEDYGPLLSELESLRAYFIRKGLFND